MTPDSLNEWLDKSFNENDILYTEKIPKRTRVTGQVAIKDMGWKLIYNRNVTK